MSNKADAMIRDLGANLAESIGVREGEDVASESSPRPQSPPGPMDALTRLKGVGLCPIELIIPDQDQPRTEFDSEADAQLLETIQRKGLQSAIRVRWCPEVGKYQIVVGERRFRACLAAGHEKIKVEVVTGEMTALDTIYDQLCENLQRQSLSAIDEARAFQRYIQLAQCTGKECADHLSISPSKVSRALSLLELPPETQTNIVSGEISARTGAALARIKDPKKQREVAKQVVEGDLPAVQVERKARQLEGPAAAPKQPVVTFKIKRGCTVLVRGRLTGAEVINALEQALEQAKIALEEGLVDECHI